VIAPLRAALTTERRRLDRGGLERAAALDPAHDVLGVREVSTASDMVGLADSKIEFTFDGARSCGRVAPLCANRRTRGDRTTSAARTASRDQREYNGYPDAT